MVLSFTAVMVLGAVALLAQAGHDAPAPAPPSPHTQRTLALTLTETDNGKDFTLPKDGLLLVRLPGNPSTGYSWVLDVDPAPLVLVTTDYVRGNEPQGIVGAPGTEQLRFKPAATGTAKITLAYRRPWEKDVPPAKTFSITVHVE